jgi:hypothetical protein
LEYLRLFRFSFQVEQIKAVIIEDLEPDLKPAEHEDSLETKENQIHADLNSFRNEPDPKPEEA